MASRRDQLQSYQFLVQRVLSALVMRETDPAQSPLRRGVGAAFAGMMILVIMAAGFAVFGLVTKTGGGRWRVDGAVVLEKETGAAFLYQRGVLHPMVNYTSALLASGQLPPPAFRESRNSLSKVRRGVLLGIPNAPNSVPARGKLVDSPLTLCAVPGTDVTGKPTTSTSLIVGTALTGRRLGDDEGLLTRDAGTGATFLVWHGHRYEIRGPNTVVSLFGALTSPMPVTSGWLNGLLTGEPIEPITLPGTGQPSVVTGYKVGELLVAQTGTKPQFYLVLSDGLAPISELEQAVTAGQSGAPPRTITLSEANNAKKSTALTKTTRGEELAPEHPPRLVTASPSGAVCAEFHDARSQPGIAVVTAAPELTSGVPTAGASQGGTALADRVAVPPGRAALVRAMPSATATTGAFSLITDLGMRYPVPTDQAVLALGYLPQRAVDLPSALISRIPAGPTLDPEAARLPIDQQLRQPGR